MDFLSQYLAASYADWVTENYPNSKAILPIFYFGGFNKTFGIEC